MRLLRLPFVISYILLAAVALAALALGGLRGFQELFAKPKPAAGPSSPVVARLNGQAITERDVAVQMALMNAVPDITPATRRQALDTLIKNRLLVEEAARRGVAFPRDQALALARQQRRMYAAGTLPEQPAVAALIKGLRDAGVGEDAYWNEVAPAQYVLVMSIAALQRSLGGDLTPSDQAAFFNRLADRLVKGASVQIVDPAYSK